MAPALLSSIEGKKRELDTLRPMSPSIVQKLKEQFLLEWTYNSNAIEGNTLSLRETELVINRGLTIGNKTLKEHFEALNHKECNVRILGAVHLPITHEPRTPATRLPARRHPQPGP